VSVAATAARLPIATEVAAAATAGAATAAAVTGRGAEEDTAIVPEGTAIVAAVEGTAIAAVAVAVDTAAIVAGTEDPLGEPMDATAAMCGDGPCLTLPRSADGDPTDKTAGGEGACEDGVLRRMRMHGMRANADIDCARARFG
jgi:hypothetical protein